jgi:hypothetical protein
MVGDTSIAAGVAAGLLPAAGYGIHELRDPNGGFSKSVRGELQKVRFLQGVEADSSSQFAISHAQSEESARRRKVLAPFGIAGWCAGV